MAINHRPIVEALIAKHPDQSKAALARLLYKAHPDRFRNVEAARTIIRGFTGACGKHLRNSVVDTLYDAEGLAKKYGIPEEIKCDFQPYPLIADKCLVLSDIHVPFHDSKALAIAIEHGVRAGCDTVLLNGDAMDCHRVSKFRKDCPPKMRFLDEVNTMKVFLQGLTKNFRQVVYKLGNHEERLESYLHDKADELFDLPQFQLSYLLDLFNLGIKWVQDKRPIRFDRLTILHGHEYQGGFVAPVNTARGLFLRAKTNAMQSHSHQTSNHTETTLEDKTISTWSTGCLCQLHPKYSPLNTKWNQGFAIVDRTTKDKFRVHNHRIINGEVY